MENMWNKTLLLGTNAVIWGQMKPYFGQRKTCFGQMKPYLAQLQKLFHTNIVVLGTYTLILGHTVKLGQIHFFPDQYGYIGDKYR